MLTSVFLMVWLTGAPDIQGLSQADVNRFIDNFLEAQDHKTAQAVEILSRHPSQARIAIDRRLKKDVAPAVAERLKALRARVLTRGLIMVIYERSKNGLTFSGQWKDLKQYDPNIDRLILDIIKEERMPGTIREAAFHVASDLKCKGLIPEFKALAGDILNPDWMIEAAGLTMAQLGDQAWLNKKRENLEAMVKDPATSIPRRYAALRKLSNYNYRIGDYDKALGNYDATIAIIEGRLKTLDKDKAGPLQETLWYTCYNAACSAAKGDKLDAAFKYLGKTIKVNPTGKWAKELEKNLQEDGDLDKVRKDGRYKDLRTRLKMLYTGQGLKL